MSSGARRASGFEEAAAVLTSLRQQPSRSLRKPVPQSMVESPSFSAEVLESSDSEDSSSVSSSSAVSLSSSSSEAISLQNSVSVASYVSSESESFVETRTSGTRRSSRNTTTSLGLLSGKRKRTLSKMTNERTAQRNRNRNTTQRKRLTNGNKSVKSIRDAPRHNLFSLEAKAARWSTDPSRTIYHQRPQPVQGSTLARLRRSAKGSFSNNPTQKSNGDFRRYQDVRICSECHQHRNIVVLLPLLRANYTCSTNFVCRDFCNFSCDVPNNAWDDLVEHLLQSSRKVTFQKEVHEFQEGHLHNHEKESKEEIVDIMANHLVPRGFQELEGRMVVNRRNTAGNLRECVFCDKCFKWRLLPPKLVGRTLSRMWECSMIASGDCSIPEEIVRPILSSKVRGSLSGVIHVDSSDPDTMDSDSHMSTDLQEASEIEHKVIANPPHWKIPPGWTMVPVKTSDSKKKRSVTPGTGEVLTDSSRIEALQEEILGLWESQERATSAPPTLRRKANSSQLTRPRRTRKTEKATKEGEGAQTEKSISSSTRKQGATTDAKGAAPSKTDDDATKESTEVSSRFTRRSRRSDGGVVELVSIPYSYDGMDWDPLFKCWVPKQGKRRNKKAT